MKLTVRNRQTNWQPIEKSVLVVGVPYIPRKGAGVHVDCMVDGGISTVSVNGDLSKYTKKELKAMGAI